MYAQVPLHRVNSETTVRSISFKFADEPAFETSLLKEQIATAEPGFFDKVKKILPLVSAPTYLFSPVELQKDVVRLRHFYQRNGFLHPDIDYMASQVDTNANSIHVIFSVEGGPPLLVHEIGFFTADSLEAAAAITGHYAREWNRVLDSFDLSRGERYTEYERLRIQDAAVTWLKNHGYAFARVESRADIDSVANRVDLRFVVDAGPITYFDEILVEGNQSVDQDVILRELPFRQGQRFSARKLSEGQRQLFSLNLFRLSLLDVPNQPVDSTVEVRVRVREARPRYVRAETGYARESGIRLEGQWSHRNFLGGARSLTLSATGNTGVLASPPKGILPAQLYRVSAALHQPYLFTRKLSVTVAPYVQFEGDQQIISPGGELSIDDAFSGINTREAGINTTFVYAFYPFRTLNVQHTFTQAKLLTSAVSSDTEVRPDTDTLSTRDVYDRNVLRVNSILGKVDNFIQPTHGFLARPFVEMGISLFGSDVSYTKIGSDVTGYLRVGRNLGLAGRFNIGRIWLSDRTRLAFDGALDLIDSLRYENRLDDVVFYAGGASDVRGWSNQLIGDKEPRRFLVKKADDPKDNQYQYFYEARGGLFKTAVNLELRLPLPGFGSAWQTALFMDGGVVEDQRPALRDFKWGTGLGIRYQTIVGYVRLDVAYKLNPDDEDLRDPEDMYGYRNDNKPFPEAQWSNRFGIHFSIGQAF